MNDEIFSRNRLFWGEDNQQILAEKHVAVFGLGGVGGFCAESLARAGIGELTIIDFDEVSCSNCNRQIIALQSTVGQNKAKLFEQRLKDINPNIKINVMDDFYSATHVDSPLESQRPMPHCEEGSAETIFSKTVDFVADAIDTMRSKISLLEYCVKNDIPVISSMGAGNRIDPTKLYLSDIKDIKDKNAPFISNILYQLKKRNIESGITVVASTEKPFSLEKIASTEKIVTKSGEELEFTKISPSSTPFVASTSGIYMAWYIVQSFLKGFK